jgi:hypothetical protein
MSDTILEQWVLALSPVILKQALEEEWHKNFPDDWKERIGKISWELARIIKDSGNKDEKFPEQVMHSSGNSGIQRTGAVLVKENPCFSCDERATCLASSTCRVWKEWVCR